jgi:YVTN family beta-propeller protein
MRLSRLRRPVTRIPIGAAFAALVAVALALPATLASPGLASTVLTSTARPALPGPGAFPAAYVGSPNFVDTCASFVPIDTESGTPGTTQVFPPCSRTNQTIVQGEAVSPDGSTLYVVLGDGVTVPQRGWVVAINTSTGKVSTPIRIGQVGWETTSIVVTPDGKTAYVANPQGDTVTPINLVKWKAEKAITVGKSPAPLAIAPDGSTVYVVLAGSVKPISLSTGKVGKAIKIAGTAGLDAIAITPDGSTAYVPNYNTDRVIPIDLATGKVGKSIRVGAGPKAIVITPDGLTAYVGSVIAGTVTPIDLATGKAGTAISIPGANPYALAADPAGGTVFAISPPSVIPIDTATDTVGSAIVLGGDPSAIAMAPGWTFPDLVPSVHSPASPALARYRGDLYAGFTTGSVVGYSYSANGGLTWSPGATVSGGWGTAQSADPPALTVRGGDLYAYWRNPAGQIRYSAFDGTSWSAPASLAGHWGTALAGLGPAVKTVGSVTYVAWQASTPGTIMYSSYSGSWSRPVTALTGAADDAPALAPTGQHADPVLLAWTKTSDAIGYGVISASGGFAVRGSVPSASTTVSPALAYAGSAANGTLYVAWTGSAGQIGYSAIYHAPSSSLKPGAWTPQEFQPESSTAVAPALTSDGSVVYLGWEGGNENVITSYALNPY